MDNVKEFMTSMVASVLTQKLVFEMEAATNDRMIEVFDDTMVECKNMEACCDLHPIVPKDENDWRAIINHVNIMREDMQPVSVELLASSYNLFASFGKKDTVGHELNENGLRHIVSQMAVVRIMERIQKLCNVLSDPAYRTPEGFERLKKMGERAASITALTFWEFVREQLVLEVEYFNKDRERSEKAKAAVEARHATKQ